MFSHKWSKHGLFNELAPVRAAIARNPVQDAVTKEVSKDKITKVIQGTSDGKTYYEFKYMAEGKKMELKVDSTGKVLKKQAEDEDEDDDKKPGK